MKTLSVDIESFSSVDLGACGLHKYMESPDFEILLIGYSFDGGPVQVHDCTRQECWPRDLLDALTDPNVLKTAFNAAFERTAFATALEEEMPPEQWSDTMVMALEMGLPGSLAAAGAALGLPEDQLKDPIGKSLIQYFSKPCRPTKSNGGRRRNLPEHDPEKWKLYIEYNRQDVVTEMAIRKKLLPLAESEQRLWCLDQRMNDRGVRIDVPMVEKIVAFDEKRREELQEEARELSGLDNPNSLAQLKGWLAGEGVSVETLRKDDLAALLSQDLPAKVRRVLEIRRALGKTSTAKYGTMLGAVCRDERIKGILQFYGANRTGRWAGRIVQVQNLARNGLPDLDLARNLTKQGDFETLETLFGETSFVFSELVRTAFIPSEGCRFVVSDFSAIEARVVAWLAGEDWVLDAFRAGKDIYCETASMMYHVPVVKHGINGELRQKGKIATLACIAEGQLVLTDQGLVPIEKVTTDMRVWDGVEWVTHGGVVYRGEREVISYGGLEATEDHIVWAEIAGERRKIHFGDAAACGARLIQSGAGRKNIRLGEDHLAGEALHERLARCDGTHGVLWMWESWMDKSQQSHDWQIKGLPQLQQAEDPPALARSEDHSTKAEMRKPERSELSELRRPGDPLRLSERDGCGDLPDRDLRTPGQGAGDRQDRQQRELCAGQCEIRGQEDEPRKQEEHGAQSLRPGELAICEERGGQEAVAGPDERRDHPGRAEGSDREEKTLAHHKRTARVYDIRNAGRRNRFTVSNCLVHNCGYGGGVGAMHAMDSSGSIPEEELQENVDRWRQANPKIVKFWRRCEAAARTAIEEHRRVRVTKALAYRFQGGHLFAELPSGRSICYWHARINPEGQLVYMGVNQTTKQWQEIETWGGKLVENLTQAVARDCLAEAMTRVSKMGYQIVMHIHDEMIVDVPVRHETAGHALDLINKAMSDPISWAPGLPLKGDGYCCDYYMKD